MKTVVITAAFTVEDPKLISYAVGDEPTVDDATAEQWVTKGLASRKPEVKPEAKPAKKSAD